MYILFGCTALFFCMIMCMYNNIKISIAVLQTAAVIVIRNIRILIIPLIAISFTLSFLLGWLYSMGYILAQANINQPTGNSQLKNINLNGKDEVKWQIAIAVFGLFWGIELLGAIFDYVIIVGVSAWYFTSNHDTRGSFSLTRGFYWAFRYNFGSLAFGSFLLALVWMIRIVFEYLDKKMKKLSENN
jgi:choline transporter-like protein 2/4/5